MEQAQDWRKFAAVAAQCAEEVGAWVKQYAGDGHLQINTKTSIQDLVTEIDKGSEERIHRFLLSRYPDHALLGEESVAAGADAAARAVEAVADREYVWVVDPIDGTMNFVHGFPFYNISIALAYRGEVVAGVVHDPSSGETFAAARGYGATCNGKPMVTSKVASLTESLIAKGIPTRRIEHCIHELQVLTPRVRGVRNMGAAALHLAYVAAGRLNGYWEQNLNAWDLAAGALLVQEAGGCVQDVDGRAYTLRTRNIIAAGAGIFDEFRELVHEAQNAAITAAAGQRAQVMAQRKLAITAAN
jgi:myo-inositol-1(or 4)-monophosphatase